MSDRIQFRRGTEARWLSVNPILMEGEIGYVTDKPNLHKMGDGVNKWADLPYRGFDGTLVHEHGDGENVVMTQKAVTDYVDALGVFEVGNDEFIRAITDEEGTLLFGIRYDGSIYQSDIDDKTKNLISELQTLIETESLKLLNLKVDKVDGKELITSSLIEVVETNELVKNPEFLTVEVDVDNNIISGRDVDGVKQESKMRINQTLDIPKSESIKIFNQAVVDDATRLAFEQKMIEDGFAISNVLDFSNSKKIEIPIPRCAILNLTADRMPTAKSGMGTVGVTCDIPTIVEFWDREGNYFKKWALNSAQGNTSMANPKKNLSMDFFNGEIDDDDSASLKFGDWVAQDSFHIKAYYTDFFRGIGAVAYKFYDDMIAARGIYKDRVWKLQNIKNDDANYEYYDGGVNDLLLQLSSEPRCYPDGFPCLIYLNNEFYGLYSFQLKKHKNNMMQIKTGKHIHLDGTINSSTLFGGSINWTSFEVRNPKDIRNHIDGTKYDGDYPKEVMGEDSEFFIPGSTNYERSAEVKGYITNLSNYAGELNTLASQAATQAMPPNGWSTAIKITETANEKSLVLYKRSETEPTIPTVDTVWDFTSNSWEDEPDGGWSLEKPEGSEQCWVTTAIAVSSENSVTIPAAMWATVREITEDVYNTKIVNLYINSAGDTPPTFSYTNDRVYNFVTGAISGDLKGWSVTIPTSDGNPCWVIKATAFEKGGSRDGIRARFSEMFDVESMVDYFVFCMFVRSTDAFAKNWQWITYDGVKWYVCPYDLDNILGGTHRGSYNDKIDTTDTSVFTLATDTNLPTRYLYNYFTEEIETAWAFFRNKGIFEADHFIKKLNRWTLDIGTDNYALEYTKWSESPCNRDRNQDTENWEFIQGYNESGWSSSSFYYINSIVVRQERCFKSLAGSNVGNDPLTSPTWWEEVTWEADKNYKVGDTCYYGKTIMFQFKCLQECINKPPITAFYSMFPYELGYRDSIYRIYQNLKTMIEIFDNKFNFNK